MENQKSEVFDVDNDPISLQRKVHLTDLIASRCLAILHQVCAQFRNKKIKRYPSELTNTISGYLGCVALIEVYDTEVFERLWNELKSIDYSKILYETPTT